MDMKIRLLWILFSLCVATLHATNPLYQSIKSQKAIILKHGAHDTSDMELQLQDSVRRGTSFEIDGNIVELDNHFYFVNAHCPQCYELEHIAFPHRDHPEQLHPAILLPEIKRSGIFLKCDFKSPRCIEAFAYLAQAIPKDQKVGHAFVKELVVPGTNLAQCCVDELITFEQVKQARQLLGGKEVPFIVSCHGVTYSNITDEMVHKLAQKAVGKAEFFNLNLPDGGNPPVRYAQLVWETYGLVPEVRIHTKADKDYWEEQLFPWIGLTDDPDLATVINLAD